MYLPGNLRNPGEAHHEEELDHDGEPLLRLSLDPEKKVNAVFLRNLIQFFIVNCVEMNLQNLWLPIFFSLNTSGPEL